VHFYDLVAEIRLQMIQNSNKLIEKLPFLMHLHSFLSAFRIIMAQERKDYNINPTKTSFKTTQCILIILCVEMRLQMI
jgi:hypothetical protein